MMSPHDESAVDSERGVFRQGHPQGLGLERASEKLLPVRPDPSGGQRPVGVRARFVYA